MNMKLHRFFVSKELVQGRVIKITDSALTKQIVKVLRLVPNQELMLLDGDGFEYIMRLSHVAVKEVVGEILKRQVNESEPSIKITLYQALLKKDNIEWALQKCTEIGVHNFVPVQTERSEKLRVNRDRAEKIIKEAAEQSGRGIIPALSEPQTFTETMKKLSRGDTPIVVLSSDGDPIGSYSLGSRLYAVNLFVGPEGGWSENELTLTRDLMKDGYLVHMLSLGPRTLRAETAGVVAAGILLSR